MSATPTVKACQLCPEPVQDYYVVTDDFRHLHICGDCLRRFGVDDWREVLNLATGQWRKNGWVTL